MSIAMRGPDGRVVYVGMSVCCEENHANVDEHGVCESIECIATKVKPSCTMCSLRNPNLFRTMKKNV